MAELIDILIPTSRKPERFHNLLFQIRAALANPLNVRVTVAMSQEWPELNAALHQEELQHVRIVTNAPDGNPGNPFHNEQGHGCSVAVDWCLRNLEWGDWWYINGDDDCLLPWALEHMVAESVGVDMVIGQVLCVSREKHLDFTPYTVGRTITRCRVSGGGTMFRMSAMRRLEQPWWNPYSGYADWELIKRMAENFPHKIIGSTVHVLALCEFEQLPANFRDEMKDFASVKNPGK